MQFFAVRVTALLVACASANPLLKDSHSDIQPLHKASTAEVSVDLFDKRANWYESKWVAGGFGLAVGVWRSGRQVWVDGFNTCSEVDTKGKKVEGTLNCIADVANILITAGSDAFAYYSGAQTIKAFFQNNLPQKRDEAVFDDIGGSELGKLTSGGWKDLWAAINATQKELARASLPGPEGHILHSLEDGVESLPNSLTFHFAPASSPEDRQLTHITNGTHGIVHLGKSSESSAHTKRNTFDFGHDVAGFKLSYTHPCRRHYKQNKNLKDGIHQIVHNWIEWAAYAQRGADAYNVELEYKGKTVILGDFIAERDGFSNNFEGLHFTPETGC